MLKIIKSFFLFSPLTLVICLVKVEGKSTLEHECKTKHFSHIFFTIKRLRFSKKSFVEHHLFFEESFTSKNLEIEFPKTLVLFLCDCLSSFPFNKLFFLLKYFGNWTMIYIHMFFQKCYSICFIL